MENLNHHIIGMEMCLVFDTFNRNDLIQELETFLDEGDCGMSRLLVSNKEPFKHQNVGLALKGLT